MANILVVSTGLAGCLSLMGCVAPTYHVFNQTDATVRIRLTPGSQPPFSFADTRRYETVISPGKTTRLEPNRQSPYPLKQPYGPMCLEVHAHKQYADLFIETTKDDLGITITAIHPEGIKVTNVSTGYPAKTSVPEQTPWSTR